MIFGIREKSIILTRTIGYCYKYTRATYDWICGPGSHMLCSIGLLWMGKIVIRSADQLIYL